MSMIVDQRMIKKLEKLILLSKGHQIIMTADLIGGIQSSGRITRRRPVRYTLRCGYNRFLKQSSSVAVETYANNNNLAGSVSEIAKEPLDLFLQLIDQNGFPFTKHILEVGIDEKVIITNGWRVHCLYKYILVIILHFFAVT